MQLLNLAKSDQEAMGLKDLLFHLNIELTKVKNQVLSKFISKHLLEYLC